MTRKWIGVVSGLLVLLLAAATAVAGPGSEQPSGGAPAKTVLFDPWANTSTPEGLAEVKAAIEAKIRGTVNATLDWIVIPREGFEEKLNTLLASKSQLDGGLGDMDDIGSMMAKEGLVRPIDDLLQQYGQNLLKKIPKVAWDQVKNPKGEIIAIPNYNRYYWQGALIRKDWLDKLGLKMPTTLAEIENVLEAFHKMDPNVIPATGPSWFMEPFMAAAVNGGVTPNIEWDTVSPEGNVILTFTHPKYEEFLKLYHKWLTKGWWNRDFLATDETQNDQLFMSGKLGLIFTDPHNITRYEAVMRETDPKASVAMVPVPSGPGGKAAYGLNTGVGRALWISSYATSAKQVVQYLDWVVSSQENYVLARLGVRGKHHVWKNGEWGLPESAGGDSSKRTYYDIYAPLDWEFLNPVQFDMPQGVRDIDKYFASLPVIMPKLYGFVQDWEPIGEVNTIDIWAEMYNIAAMARPLSDYPGLCKEYYETGGSKIYDELTRQYKEWLKTRK